MKHRNWIFMPAALLAACASTPPAQKTAGLERIEHIVVIYAENRSFDNLYGLFPGANGIANSTVAQTDHDGSVLAHLPPVWKGSGKEAEAQFPPALANWPFRIDAPPINLPLEVKTQDLVHKYYQHIEQINGGKLDRFAAVSDAGALSLGHYDGSRLPLWQWAKEFTLADNFFMAAFGGSYLNHQWLACACTPLHPNAPPKKIAALDERGLLQRAASSPASALQGAPVFERDGSVTPDGFSVNTDQPPYQPSAIPPAPGGDSRFANPAYHPLPSQTAPTLGDRLSEKGVSWAWYAGAWKLALEDGMQAPDAKRKVIYTSADSSPNFQPHHQPYNYFARYAPGTAERAAHLKDGDEFLAAIDAGTLPQVAFYKPQGSLNEHPGYADVYSGDEHIASILERIRKSPSWNKVAVVVTYDENGGFFDHVPPPKGDRWGPGSRIPAIIVSPFAKRGFVDHTQYDTTSIHQFISTRFGLQLLPGVRRQMGDLTAAFELAP